MSSITIGSHSNNLSLFILRHRNELEQQAAEIGYQVSWYDYDNGGDSTQFMLSEKLDIAGTGSTPPVIADAQGIDVRYLAASEPRSSNSALLSRFEHFDQLKGQKIAAMVGSFTDHFIAVLLNKYGWKLKDIDLVDVRGEAALVALKSGEVAGWLAVDPWLKRAEQEENFYILANVGENIVNRSVFWTRSSIINQHPAFEIIFLKVLRENDLWIAGNPEQAAQILKQNLNANLSDEHWLNTINGRTWGIVNDLELIDAEQLQQKIDLQKAGFIS